MNNQAPHQDASSSKASRLRTLVEEHKERLYYLALDLTGNHHDAEDLSQDVFVKAYEALDDFRGEAAAYSWLYRITVNTYLNAQRKKSVDALWDDFNQQPACQDGLPKPDQRAEARGIQEDIEQALDALSPRERTAFVLRQYQDLSVKETAAAMNVAEGTVKSFLYRAMQKLRKALDFRRDDLETQ